MTWDAGVSALLQSATPALPNAWLVRVYLHLGWAVVLAAGGLWLLPRASYTARCVLAGGVFAWALLPGPLSPAHWLGLAFQAPSLTSVLLGAWWVQRALFSGARSVARPPLTGWMGWWLVAPAVLLGYALLLDTLALWTWHMVEWGFSAALLLALMGWTLVPWLRGGHLACATLPMWMAPAALLLFAATRLPSGNVWDALLDPLLWLLLQGLLLGFLRRQYRLYRAQPAPRP